MGSVSWSHSDMRGLSLVLRLGVHRMGKLNIMAIISDKAKCLHAFSKADLGSDFLVSVGLSFVGRPKS